MKKMILKRRIKKKKKMNKSGKTQERDSILVRHTNPNRSHREDLHKITSGANLKPRLQMNA